MNALNRRDFLKGSTALMSLASFGLLGMDFKNRKGPLHVALIGAGWYGKSDLFRLIQVADVDVVALCDVDSKQLEEAGKLVSTRQKSGKIPALYEDYKELLAKEKPEYVLIGSPDHWHALMAIDSIKSGAHVYLQKPISVDVIEGEAILAAARKYGRKVQIGTQRRSTPHLVQAKKEIIDKALKRDDWNNYRIRCEGKRIQLWLNGQQTVDYTEPDDKIPQSGKIAVQIHVGPPSEAWYKDIVVVELK